MVTIINDDDRIFQAWGSVETRDSDGDIILMDDLKPVMLTLMKRGGQIVDGHSNRVVGKILNFDFTEKKVGKKSVPGVLLTCQIFKDYITDDEVWADIKNGDSTGMSFGGKTRKREFKVIKGEATRILKEIEAFEFTVVRPGNVPVNTEASLIAANMVAKSKQEDKETEWAWKCQVTGVCDKEQSVLKSMTADKGCSAKEEVEETVKEEDEVTQVIKEGVIIKSKTDGQHYFKSNAEIEKMKILKT